MNFLCSETSACLGGEVDNGSINDAGVNTEINLMSTHECVNFDEENFSDPICFVLMTARYLLCYTMMNECEHPFAVSE